MRLAISSNSGFTLSSFFFQFRKLSSVIPAWPRLCNSRTPALVGMPVSASCKTISATSRSYLLNNSAEISPDRHLPKSMKNCLSFCWMAIHTSGKHHCKLFVALKDAAANFALASDFLAGSPSLLFFFPQQQEQTRLQLRVKRRIKLACRLRLTCCRVRLNHLPNAVQPRSGLRFAASLPNAIEQLCRFVV